MSPSNRPAATRATGAPPSSLIYSGHVEWRERHGAVEVKFRPSLVTALAHNRILSWLDCGPGRRVVFAYWAEDQWHHEIHRSGRAAVKRFEALVAQYGGGDYGQALRRMKSLTDITRHRPFEKAINLWSQCRHDFALQDHLPVIQNLMKGRATLLRAARDGELYLERPGPGLTMATRRWAARNTSVPVSKIPYYRYAWPIFDGFAEVRQTESPIADEIDIFLTWPGLTPIRLSYHRLVLPVRVSGADWILSSTILDDDVDLLP